MNLESCSLTPIPRHSGSSPALILGTTLTNSHYVLCFVFSALMIKKKKKSSNHYSDSSELYDESLNEDFFEDSWLALFLSSVLLTYLKPIRLQGNHLHSLQLSMQRHTYYGCIYKRFQITSDSCILLYCFKNLQSRLYPIFYKFYL